MGADPSLATLGHTTLVEVARTAVLRDPEEAERVAKELAHERLRESFQSVINATGVLLHTNLGRAPLSRPENPRSAVRYSNLEFDLATGQRGSRRSRIEPMLAGMCGTEAALVVNNCAAALVLVLAAHASGRGVAVSRGELVEIGGGFRIPEVLEQSGARLVEVGTTNRTRLSDYQRACEDESKSVELILKVHTSNYRLIGFTEEVDVSALTSLGKLTVADIGSGLLDSRTPWLAQPDGRIPSLPWLNGEPAVRQTIEAGADLVLFSCDKLLGGPQAGVIVGSKDLVDRCAKHPLARALRPGSLVLELLQSTLRSYAARDVDALPFWKMATTPVEELKRRADRVAENVSLPWCVSESCESVPGGGTLPEVSMPSHGVSLRGNRTKALRQFSPPVIARVVHGATVLDLRTVDPADDSLLVEAIRSSEAETAANKAGPNGLNGPNGPGKPIEPSEPNDI